MSRSIHLPIVTAGRSTGRTVEIATALPFKQLAAHLVWLGFRLVSGPRGRAAVERLH